MHTKHNTEWSVVFIFIDSFVLDTEHFIQASEHFSSQWHIFVIKGVNSFGVKFFAIILNSSVIYSVHIFYNIYFFFMPAVCSGHLLSTNPYTYFPSIMRTFKAKRAFGFAWFLIEMRFAEVLEKASPSQIFTFSEGKLIAMIVFFGWLLCRPFQHDYVMCEVVDVQCRASARWAFVVKSVSFFFLENILLFR